jgi:hypothetical protein
MKIFDFTGAGGTGSGSILGSIFLEPQDATTKIIFNEI